MFTKEGESVGPVKDILFIEGNDLLLVERENRELLVPFADSICLEVDLERRSITIDPPDGLLNLDEI